MIATPKQNNCLFIFLRRNIKIQNQDINVSHNYHRDLLHLTPGFDGSAFPGSVVTKTKPKYTTKGSTWVKILMALKSK